MGKEAKQFCVQEGDKFARLTVLSVFHKDHSSIQWCRCKCDCGGNRVARVKDLVSGHIKGCSVCGHSKIRPIVIGAKYGRLTVISTYFKPTEGQIAVCRCECGKVYEAKAQYLVIGHTGSCGCLPNRCNSLGFCSTELSAREQQAWKSFQQLHRRCNPNNARKFDDYYGRGIRVSPEWSWTVEGWNNFRDWFMDQEFRLGYSLDRINNDGPYSSDNCRLASITTQNRNKRNSRIYQGLHIFDWADKLGFSHNKAKSCWVSDTFPELIARYQEKGGVALCPAN